MPAKLSYANQITKDPNNIEKRCLIFGRSQDEYDLFPFLICEPDSCLRRFSLENVVKIMEIVDAKRHVNTVSIAQQQNIAHKTVWNHLKETGYRKKIRV